MGGFEHAGDDRRPGADGLRSSRPLLEGRGLWGVERVGEAEGAGMVVGRVG